MQVILDSLPYLLVGPFPDGPLGGLALTIVLALFIGGVSFGIGTVFAALALVPFMPVRLAARATVECVRGVPSLTFLFWMYFLVPRLLQIDLSPMMSAVIALSIYHGAYMAEDLRGGVQAVHRGQWEAARATGLRGRQVFLRIVLPQAVCAVVPALINRFVNLFMYTSIVSTLGILEFMRARRSSSTTASSSTRSRSSGSSAWSISPSATASPAWAACWKGAGPGRRGSAPSRLPREKDVATGAELRDTGG